MATLVLTDAVLNINGVNLSAFCKSVEMTYDVEAKDETAMGDITHANLGGLKNWSIKATLMQDYAAAAVDISLFSLLGTIVTVFVKPTSAANSTTNPAYTGTGLLQSYKPIGGQIGELHMTEVNFVPGGATPTLTRVIV